MVAINRLTDTAIRGAIAERERLGASEQFLWDASLPGFGIRVAPSAVTFIVKYAVRGGRNARQRKFKIGRFGSLNATTARAEAQSILRRVARGEDPAGEREGKRNDPSVSDVLEEFLADHVTAKRKATTAVEYRRLTEKFLKPQIGQIRIQELVTADVSRLHRKLSATPYQANRVLALASKLCSWAEGEAGYRSKFSNPCRGIEKYGEKKRERYLSADEIERLGKALSESDEWPPAVTAIRLLIVTGARHREITKLRWSEVDIENGVARLADTKTGARILQLPPPALEILAGLHREKDNPYVIAGRRRGTHLVGLNHIWQRIRLSAGLDGLHIHDLRHSFATIAVSGGSSLRLIGAVLGHRSMAATERYAHAAPDPTRAVAEKVSGEIAALLRKGAAS